MADLLKDCPDLAKFLKTEPAATIALPIDEEGTIHAASLLYSHVEEPLRFYFVTSKNTEKCQLLLERGSLPAACVVGTGRGTDCTLQMRGIVRIVDKEGYDQELDAYYKKRGDHHDDIVDPVNVLLEFTPAWARYTDYTKGYERRMLDVSDGAADEQTAA